MNKNGRCENKGRSFLPDPFRIKIRMGHCQFFKYMDGSKTTKVKQKNAEVRRVEK